MLSSKRVKRATDTVLQHWMMTSCYLNEYLFEHMNAGTEGCNGVQPLNIKRDALINFHA